MPNICSFTLRVSGPSIQRRQFRVSLEKHVQRITNGPWAGEFVVILPPQVWGKLEDTFFWGVPSTDTEGFIRSNEDALEVRGESKWSPPLEWLERASHLFPDLDFEISSLTEHEMYERWTAHDGEVHQLNEELVDPQTEEVLRAVVDGEVLIDKTQDGC